MAKADRQPILLYRVWDPLNESPHDGREYGAIDTECAARLHAEYHYSHQDGYERKWPLTFHIIDPHDGQTYAVDVEIDMRPVFHAAPRVKLR